MIDALKGVNSVMSNVNDNMDVSQIKDVLKEFSKQSEKMEMQQEMMSDQMDMAMDNGDMVDQAEEVYTQILGEIGMNLNDEMKTGKGNIAAQNSQQNLD
jgi:charged multivesicular body protein 2A